MAQSEWLWGFEDEAQIRIGSGSQLHSFSLSSLEEPGPDRHSRPFEELDPETVTLRG